MDLHEDGVWGKLLLFAHLDRELYENGGVFKVNDVADRFTNFFDDFGFAVCE